jgi:SAM-dependent methyltransferase
MELRAKTLVRGALTFLPVIGKKIAFSKTGGTNSARYCYAVWMRHWMRLKEQFPDACWSTVAEVGPGDSLGTGLCALILGASRYYAIDVQMLANAEMNLQVLKELVPILKRHETIPDRNEYPDIFPHLSAYDFPEQLLETKELDKRETDIARALVEIGGSPVMENMIGYCLAESWSAIPSASVDVLFSQAVMSYVDDLENMYAFMGKIVKPGGFISHTIPCSCIGTTRHWNGHYSVPNWQWRLAKGNRPCFISRTPCSRHLELISKAGFDPIVVERATRHDGINRSQLAKKFKSLSDDDLNTSGVYVLARRKA